VNEVKGIRSMEIKAYVKDTDTQSISSISDGDFQTNKDIAVTNDTMLLFNTTDRLLIDIDN
ncbi:DUF276 domain-containing protein, partial [Borreliella garinii]